MRAEKEAEEHKLRLQEVEEKHKQETKEKRSSLQSELNYSYYSSMGFLSLHEVTINIYYIYILLYSFSNKFGVVMAINGFLAKV